MNAPLNISCD